MEPFPENEFSESQTVEQKHINEIDALKQRINLLEAQAQKKCGPPSATSHMLVNSKCEIPSPLWWSVLFNNFAVLSIAIGLLV